MEIHWAKLIIISQKTIHKIVNKGLKLLGGITNAYSIERDIFVRVQQCTKCLSLDHGAKSCTWGQKCVRCGEGHIASQCESTNEKCVNCGGAHNSLMRKCQRRKELFAQKVKTIKDRANDHLHNNNIANYSSSPLTTKKNKKV